MRSLFNLLSRGLGKTLFSLKRKRKGLLSPLASTIASAVSHNTYRHGCSKAVLTEFSNCPPELPSSPLSFGLAGRSVSSFQHTHKHTLWQPCLRDPPTRGWKPAQQLLGGWREDAGTRGKAAGAATNTAPRSWLCFPGIATSQRLRDRTLKEACNTWVTHFFIAATRRISLYGII